MDNITTRICRDKAEKNKDKCVKATEEGDTEKIKKYGRKKFDYERVRTGLISFSDYDKNHPSDSEKTRVNRDFRNNLDNLDYS
jgi:hypothetical protein